MNDFLLKLVESDSRVVIVSNRHIDLYEMLEKHELLFLLHSVEWKRFYKNKVTFSNRSYLKLCKECNVEELRGCSLDVIVIDSSLVDEPYVINTFLPNTFGKKGFLTKVEL